MTQPAIPAAPSTRWRRRKEARPGEILDAALACFAERGFAATRLDTVAKRAGVTKGTLYLYFPNKAELFKAVVRQAIVANIARGEALVAESAEPAPVLLERLIHHWAQLILRGLVAGEGRAARPAALSGAAAGEPPTRRKAASR